MLRQVIYPPPQTVRSPIPSEISLQGDGPDGENGISTPTALTLGAETDEQSQCSICLEAFNAGEKVYRTSALGCDHIFHCECIVEWFMRRDTCPCCRRVVLPTTNAADGTTSLTLLQDIELGVLQAI